MVNAGDFNKIQGFMRNSTKFTFCTVLTFVKLPQEMNIEVLQIKNLIHICCKIRNLFARKFLLKQNQKCPYLALNLAP
jgi:hypothetical protein